MKKAKTVEIPDEILDLSTYEDLRNHALRSSIWYAQRYLCHSSKLKKRLYEKGYTREPVLYRDEYGKEISSNIVDEVMEQMDELSYLDDERFIERKIESELRKGRGVSLIKLKLLPYGVSEDEFEKVLSRFDSSDFEEKNNEAIEKAFRKIVRSSRFKKADNDFMRESIVISTLLSKGFDFDDIKNFIEESVNDWGIL